MVYGFRRGPNTCYGEQHVVVTKLRSTSLGAHDTLDGVEIGG